MYGKIFDSIFDSSIMEEDIEIRYVWMCMLATADREGFVDATIPALARKFNVPIEKMQKAIEAFLSPDPTSRTPDNEGRRIEPIRESFGWRIINYEKYRDMRDEEGRREYLRNYMRDYMRKYRAKDVKQESLTVKHVKPCYTNTDTDTDTYTDIDNKESPKNLGDFFSESQLTEVERHCKTLATHFKKNFWPWVQTQIKNRYRADAIIFALAQLWEYHESTKDPWPYLNHILVVEHQNANEREHIVEHEKLKQEGKNASIPGFIE